MIKVKYSYYIATDETVAYYHKIGILPQNKELT